MRSLFFFSNKSVSSELVIFSVTPIGVRVICAARWSSFFEVTQNEHRLCRWDLGVLNHNPKATV